MNVLGGDTALRRRLRTAAHATLRAESIQRGQLEIAVVSDADMAAMHRQWKGHSGPTDVLTFDLRDRPSTGRVDGQIVICSDVARRQSARLGIDWRLEAALYVIHGCLHLCGYDDHRKRDFERMHRREDEILSALGWGPVFAVAKKSIRPARSAKPRVRKARK